MFPVGGPDFVLHVVAAQQILRAELRIETHVGNASRCANAAESGKPLLLGAPGKGFPFSRMARSGCFYFFSCLSPALRRNAAASITNRTSKFLAFTLPPCRFLPRECRHRRVLPIRYRIDAWGLCALAAVPGKRLGCSD